MRVQRRLKKKKRNTIAKHKGKHTNHVETHQVCYAWYTDPSHLREIKERMQHAWSSLDTALG